ncbi:DUF3389 family protein [Shewanella marisflavi]|uniref:PTS sugar transporter subunit IIA n=1 Tax=Shewanella marisflavi TaxID=260364 RepID=A0AAC9XNH1_9GAMM|nr:DUF3389 family protein [Shewanella marisflavi]ASJ96638.1 PTS sugar transporter subunit IIA [Shewanella marisflavi]
MVIEFSGGRLIVSPQEVLVKLNASGASLYAMADDVRLLSAGHIMVADAGAVQWHLTLDGPEQLAEVADCLGVAIS